MVHNDLLDSQQERKMLLFYNADMQEQNNVEMEAYINTYIKYKVLPRQGARIFVMLAWIIIVTELY